LARHNIAHVWWIKPVTWFTPSNVIYVLAFDIILSVLNTGLNMTCAQKKKNLVFTLGLNKFN
jgi:hypothetical protein